MHPGPAPTQDFSSTSTRPSAPPRTTIRLLRSGRLAGRQAFPIGRESYFYRPLDLFGICIGAHYCPSLTDQDRAWLRGVLQQGRTRLAEGSRAYYLGSIAASHLGANWTVQQPRTEDLPLATLCLLYWITTHEPLAKVTGVTLPAPALASAILSRALMIPEHYIEGPVVPLLGSQSLGDADLPMCLLVGAVVEFSLAARRALAGMPFRHLANLAGTAYSPLRPSMRVLPSH